MMSSCEPRVPLAHSKLNTRRAIQDESHILRKEIQKTWNQLLSSARCYFPTSKMPSQSHTIQTLQVLVSFCSVVVKAGVCMQPSTQFWRRARIQPRPSRGLSWIRQLPQVSKCKLSRIVDSGLSTICRSQTKRDHLSPFFRSGAFQ